MKGVATMGRLAFTLFVLAGLASVAVSDSDHVESKSHKRRARNDAAIELQGLKTLKNLRYSSVVNMCLSMQTWTIG